MKRNILFVCVLSLAVLATGVLGAAKETAAASAVPEDPQTAPGNIFLETEPLVIQCLADGTVDYTVKDFWGQTVATGKAPVENGVASIKPDIKKRGYYEITCDAGTVCSSPRWV